MGCKSPYAHISLPLFLSFSLSICLFLNPTPDRYIVNSWTGMHSIFPTVLVWNLYEPRFCHPIQTLGSVLWPAFNMNLNLPTRHLSTPPLQPGIIPVFDERTSLHPDTPINVRPPPGIQSENISITHSMAEADCRRGGKVEENPSVPLIWLSWKYTRDNASELGIDRFWTNSVCGSVLSAWLNSEGEVRWYKRDNINIAWDPTAKDSLDI